MPMRSDGESVAERSTTSTSAESGSPVWSEAQKPRWTSRNAGGGIGKHLGFGGAGALGLGQEVVERRNVIVPLDERRDAPEACDGAPIEIPHLVAHGMVVRVEQVRAVVGVSSQVDLTDAAAGN